MQKPLDGNKMPIETILELGAEGGSITVFAVPGKDGARKFLIDKNQVALFDLGLDLELDGDPITKSAPLDSWDEAVHRLNENPNWYRLYPVTVHPDFENRILALVEEKGGMPAVARWRERLDIRQARGVGGQGEVV